MWGNGKRSLVPRETCSSSACRSSESRSSARHGRRRVVASTSISVCRLASVPTIGEGYRSEEHTSELQSLMRISYAVFCLKKKKSTEYNTYYEQGKQLKSKE